MNEFNDEEVHSSDYQSDYQLSIYFLFFLFNSTSIEFYIEVQVKQLIDNDELI